MSEGGSDEFSSDVTDLEDPLRMGGWREIDSNMQLWSPSPNIFVNGDSYLKGFLGLDWLPSNDAIRNKQRYETWCKQSLSTLLSKYTSYWVMKEVFAKTPKRVTLEPLREEDTTPPPDIPKEWINPMDFQCKAKVDPSDLQKATKSGMQVGDNEKVKGLGTGSDAVLRINPWNYHNVGGKCPVAPGRGGDEILLHEMVHALSSLMGKLANTAVGPLDYTNLEEFTAIVIANVYSSETKRPLRADHGGFDLLKPALSTSQAFYDKYKDYLQQVVRNHPNLTKKLAEATGIPFNPFTLCSF